jgi:hypothetical protein
MFAYFPPMVNLDHITRTRFGMITTSISLLHTNSQTRCCPSVRLLVYSRDSLCRNQGHLQDCQYSADLIQSVPQHGCREPIEVQMYYM